MHYEYLTFVSSLVFPFTALIVFIFDFIALIVLISRTFKATKETLTCHPVTILRPLKGTDPNLFKNLESSFLQLSNAPIQIIFTVKTDSDPCIHIVKELLTKYPNHDAQLVIGQGVGLINPKVDNLFNGYSIAKHDIIWVIDSNVLFTSNTVLSRSADLLSEPGVGMVHHLPVCRDASSFGSMLELEFINLVHTRVYLSVNWIAIASCLIGKSNMVCLFICACVSCLPFFLKENFLKESCLPYGEVD